jgi:hypothetical protein
MHRPLLVAVGTAVTWLGLAGAGARAEMIPWSYSWTPNVTAVSADSPGTGKIVLQSEPGATASGSSDIVATNLQTVSSADDDHPDHFTDTSYQLNLTLTDLASHAAGSLTFAGLLNGTISKLTSDISNTFTGPTTQTLALGANVYTVTIGPYTPPAPPDAVNLGAIGAHAQVSVRPAQSPEPSTLVLAGLALAAVGAVIVRRGLPGRWAGGSLSAG